MASTLNRRTGYMHTLGKIRQTTVSGTFRPNGSSAIATSSGASSSVSYVSTGLYRVFLAHAVPNGEDLQARASARFAAKDGRVIEVGTVSAGDSTTGANFYIRSMNVGTTTLSDIAADANNVMSWELRFANSGVTR